MTMPKKAAAPARPKEKPKQSLRSIFFNFHTEKNFPLIRDALKKFYGRERQQRRKTIPALKGRELEAKVNQQMRFLHPGLK
jgi:hypothetical protein